MGGSGVCGSCLRWAVKFKLSNVVITIYLPHIFIHRMDIKALSLFLGLLVAVALGQTWNAYTDIRTGTNFLSKVVRNFSAMRISVSVLHFL